MATPLIEDIAKNVRLVEDANDEEARKNIVAAANELIDKYEKPIDKLARFGWKEPSRMAALRTAFELGLFTTLEDEPMTSAQLAEGTKAEPLLVARVMKNLAANGIVKEIGSDQYCGTPFSRSMNEPAFGGGLVYFSEALIPIFWGIPEFLAKTDYQSPNDETKGPCQYALKTEKQFFDLFQENTHLAKGFNALMDGYSRTRPRWVDFYPLERLGAQAKDGPFLVDIGGGLGGEITDFHNRCPDVSGQLVLQDIPAIISEVQSSSKLPSAIKPVVHDFFQPQPPEYRGARAYFIRLVLHDWTDSRCHLILSHLRDAMIPGWSKLLINENCLSDAGTDWRHTSLDWVMMALFASRARTESQWRALLSSAGLKVTGIWHKEVASESVIEAVRMDEVTNEICSTTFGLDRNCR